nr:MAG TPA: hypothetical protein [Caudoviricetes sp.]
MKLTRQKRICNSLFVIYMLMRLVLPKKLSNVFKT